MATTELTIRQLADEGGTAPIAPVTVTDAVLKGDGTTLTEELTALNNDLTNLSGKFKNVTRLQYLISGNNCVVRFYVDTNEFYYLAIDKDGTLDGGYYKAS